MRCDNCGELTPLLTELGTVCLCNTCFSKMKKDIEESKVSSNPNYSFPEHKEQGIKFDTSKLRYDLIPPEIKLYLAEILTHGAEKYAPNNWKHIEVERYIAAFERHFNAWQLGEELDKDSGFHHLKHALTNIMFICYLTCVNKEKSNDE